MSSLINSGILEELRAEYTVIEKTFRPLETFIKLMDDQQATVEEIVNAAEKLDIDVSFTLSYSQPIAAPMWQTYIADAKIRKERMESIEEEPVNFNSRDTTMISDRVYNLLDGAFIYNLNELQFMDEAYLLCIRGFGEKSLKEVKAVMAMKGLKIGSLK